MRKSRDLEDDKEPGKFSTNLPSVHTHVTHNPFSPPPPPSAESVPEASSSPFSPVKEKTLDPLESARSPSTPGAGVGAGGGGGGIKRSVSEAMSQAQAQATQQVEECLENTHLSDQGQRLHTLQEKEEPGSGTVTRTSLRPVRTSSLQQSQSQVGGLLEVESPSLQRTVLAPPGQAPIRGVPGPRVDVEKSPFLSDDEQEKGKQLRTKESWEDFEE